MKKSKHVAPWLLSALFFTHNWHASHKSTSCLTDTPAAGCNCLLKFSSTVTLSSNIVHYRVCVSWKSAFSHPPRVSMYCTRILSPQLWHVPRPSIKASVSWVRCVKVEEKRTFVEVARSEIENFCCGRKPDSLRWRYPWRNFILSTLPIATSPMCRKRKNLPSSGMSIIQCLAGPEAVTLMGSKAKGTLLPPTYVIFSRDYVLMLTVCLWGQPKAVMDA